MVDKSTELGFFDKKEDKVGGGEHDNDNSDSMQELEQPAQAMNAIRPGEYSAPNELDPYFMGTWKLGQLVGFWLGVFLCLIFGLIEFSDEYPLANDTFAITLLTASWWVFEVFPLAVTSLVPLIFFPFCEIVKGKDLSKEYFNYISFLFVGAFLVDMAIEHVNLHKRVALNVLLCFGLKPKILLLGFLVIAASISMVCSNTSTCIMLLPIATGIANSARDSLKRKSVSAEDLEEGVDQMKMMDLFEKGVLFAIAYGATCGGISTTIGTPPNGVHSGLIDSEFPDSPAIEFNKWFAFAFPMTVCMILFTWALLSYMYAWNLKTSLQETTLVEELRALGPVDRDQIIVGLCLGLQVVFWVIRPYAFLPFVGQCSDDYEQYGNESDCEDAGGKWTDYVDDGTVALFAAFFLFATPSVQKPGKMILDERDFQNLPWGLLVLFGGGFAIAKAFKDSGLSILVGQQLESFISLGTYGLAQMIALVVVFLTELTSNTATTNIIVPVVLPLASENNLHPFVMSLPVTISCSMAFMFPVATPPNAVVFGTGKIRFREMVKTGFFLNIVAILLIPILMSTSAKIFDIDSMPDWAKPVTPDAPTSAPTYLFFTPDQTIIDAFPETGEWLCTI